MDETGIWEILVMLSGGEISLSDAHSHICHLSGNGLPHAESSYPADAKFKDTFGNIYTVSGGWRVNAHGIIFVRVREGGAIQSIYTPSGGWAEVCLN